MSKVVGRMKNSRAYGMAPSVAGKTPYALNWKKGFNRLSVIAAIGWAVYVSVERWHEVSAFDS